MLESKPKIGLTWEPKLPIFTSSETKSTGSQKSEKVPANTIWKTETELVDGLFVPPNDPKKLNKLSRKQLKDTAGKNWFDMPAPTITPEIKKDFQILKLRSVMDPKRHYKKADMKSKELPKYFQASLRNVGTVIESASDFFSGRLTKKERKATLAEEILSDRTLGDYRKRKVREIEKQKNVVGVEKWKIKGKQSWKRAKHRRDG
ncbi:Fcf2 pre-rRNA processing [Macleaya cordata]|uniref:Fcf2 pre-rRNA processing n=1 Tax=Macleaya cordata TaxID=56857 RepID=A0A200QHC3_MACCD|nr:Fcf2 pre-rRNA processing [Macleaya cordata]